MDSRDHLPMRLSSSEPPGTMMGSFSYSQALPSNAGTVDGVNLSFGHVSSSRTSRPAEVQVQAYNGDGLQGMRPAGGFRIGDPMRKKRGRPRKYGPDGNLAPGYPESQSSEPSVKRRGRPPGSGRKQQFEALGPAGSDFIPHVITVRPGENVASKIMAFSQQGPRSICILSASGIVSNVAFRQPATCGGTVTYEGRFEILSLCGSYMLTETGDTRSRTGGLSVALGGSDGNVLGGGVAGVLTAATPVQVIVGSFLAEGKRLKPSPIISDPLPIISDPSLPQRMPSLGGPLPGSPHSQERGSDSSNNDDNDDDDVGSPFNQHDSGFNDPGQQHVLNPSGYNPLSWSHPLNHQRQ